MSEEESEEESDEEIEEGGDKERARVDKEQVRHSIKVTQNMAYSKQLAAIEQGKLNGSNSLYIGKASTEMQKVGISDAPFAMNQSDYRKSRRESGKNKHYSSHAVPVEFFETMPVRINSAPLMIFNEGKITFITDYRMNDKKGNPSYVIIGVWPNQQMENDTVNLVKSVYPLEDFIQRLEKRANEGKLVAINKSNAEKMLTTIGVQPSKVSSILDIAKSSISQISEKSTPFSNKIQLSDYFHIKCGS